MNELMILFFENDWLMYGVYGAAVFGCLVQIVLLVIYNRSLNASDRMRSTKLTWLKQMKTRFESGYEWNNRIRNVELFVDKNLGRRKWMGIYLKTWEAIGRMMIPVVLIFSALGAAIAAVYRQDRTSALLYLTYGIVFAVIMYGVMVLSNVKEKQNLLHTNLCEYFENTLQGEARKRYRKNRYAGESYFDMGEPREEIACTKTESVGENTERKAEQQDKPQDGKSVQESAKEQKQEQKQMKEKAKQAKQESKVRAKQKKEADKEAARLQRKQEKEKKKVAKLTKRMEKMQRRMGVTVTAEGVAVREAIGNLKEEAAQRKREQLKRKVDVSPAQEDQIISEVLREFLV